VGLASKKTLEPFSMIISNIRGGCRSTVADTNASREEAERKPISLVTVSDFGVILMILTVASQKVFPSKIDVVTWYSTAEYIG